VYNNYLKFNQGVTKFGKAPHKVVLILSILEMLDRGLLYENRIVLNDTLIYRFHKIWKRYVITGHIPTITLPFYHLSKEKSGIWKLHSTNNIEFKATLGVLTFSGVYASINPKFFLWLTNIENRNLYKQELVDKYFPNNLNYKQQDADVFSSLVYEPEVNYAKLVKRKERKKKEEWKEEQIVRSVEFPKAVKQVYDNTCAVSGLKVEISGINPLLEACHIKPFSEDYQDVIVNGIAMSPTFHTAFDKGLLAINDSYKIIISRSVSRNKRTDMLWSIDNTELTLPKEERFYPSLEYLDWHRKEVFR
jgi:putative restriction endonuclease